MSSQPPPEPPSRGRTPWVGVSLAVVALLVGAATGTLPFVLAVVGLVALGRWARVAGRGTVDRILTAAEYQMTPSLDALGFTIAAEGVGPRAPDDAVAAVLPAGGRTVRQRFVPREDLRALEIATLEVTGGLAGLRQRAVVTVAHELADPADAPAASALLQASTVVPAGEVPETTRFACEHGWLVASFDPLRSRDPGAVAGLLASALTRIVEDARRR